MCVGQVGVVMDECVRLRKRVSELESQRDDYAWMLGEAFKCCTSKEIDLIYKMAGLRGDGSGVRLPDLVESDGLAGREMECCGIGGGRVEPVVG